MTKPRDLANSVNTGAIPGTRLENGAVTNAKLAFDGGALSGLRNIIINGLVNTTREINQRGLTHSGVSNGDYFADRWKRVDSSNMTQIIEEGNFEPSATYTLSGVGVATDQLTAPASGNWTLPSIPSTASKIQLEKGTVATPFEERFKGLELALCQRYYETVAYPPFYFPSTSAALMYVPVYYKVKKRGTPVVTLPSSTNAAYNAAGSSVTPTTWNVAGNTADSVSITVGNSSLGGVIAGVLTSSAEL
jgi:hypothetical protein